MHEEIGRVNFLALYVICGLFGNLTSLYYHVLRRNLVHVSLGASGAGFGIIGAYFAVRPE